MCVLCMELPQLCALGMCFALPTTGHLRMVTRGRREYYIADPGEILSHSAHTEPCDSQVLQEIPRKKKNLQEEFNDRAPI